MIEATRTKPGSARPSSHPIPNGPALRRLLAALAAGLVGGGVSAVFLTWQAAALIGWDLAASLLVTRIWWTVIPMTPTECAKHAVREDPSRAIADSIVLVASIANLASVALILVKASSATGGTKAFYVTVGVLSVVLAWLAVHSVFTLRYARIYYSGRHGGVDFNGDTDPDYVDFAYLSFTIGMTFQVSDTDLSSRAIRRTALRHALISYLFGAVIVGLIINVVASLLH